jgi:drug/metabolite transporter (DMT)-like permease
LDDRIYGIGAAILGIVFVLAGMLLYAIPYLIGRPVGYLFEAAREWGAPAFIVIGIVLIALGILLAFTAQIQRSKANRRESPPPPS